MPDELNAIVPQVPNSNKVPDDNKDLDADKLHRLRFCMHDGLVYYINLSDGRRRLCILKALAKEVFKLAYDRYHHLGFHRCYERLAQSIYIRNMASRLKRYIKHCPKCILSQTKRHAPYGELQPVETPNVPFHTVTLDFIVALPDINGIDSVMTITYKASKKV